MKKKKNEDNPILYVIAHLPDRDIVIFPEKTKKKSIEINKN